MRLVDLDADLLNRVFEAPSRWVKYRVLRDALPDAGVGELAELIYGVDTPVTRRQILFLERYGDSIRHRRKR